MDLRSKKHVLSVTICDQKRTLKRRIDTYLNFFRLNQITSRLHSLKSQTKETNIGWGITKIQKQLGN